MFTITLTPEKTKRFLYNLFIIAILAIGFYGIGTMTKVIKPIYFENIITFIKNIF